MPDVLEQIDVAREFAKQVYKTAWQTKYRGIPTLKYPCDLWIYQEIIHEVQPDLIVECGTYKGGTALFLADLCEAIGKGCVLSIDRWRRPGLPRHTRLSYLEANSLDVVTIDLRRDRTRMLVILDSDHREEHVLTEMEHYAPLVAVGSYLIVEDTNVAGNPIEDGSDANPMAAVKRFLAVHPEFEVDHSRERYIVTQNPSGYLRRIA